MNFEEGNWKHISPEATVDFQFLNFNIFSNNKAKHKPLIYLNKTQLKKRT